MSTVFLPVKALGSDPMVEEISRG